MDVQVVLYPLPYTRCAALTWLVSEGSHASCGHQNSPKHLLSFSSLSVAHKGLKRHSPSSH